MLRFALPAILLGLVSLGAAFCGTPDLTDEDHAILRELHANSSNRLDTRSLAVDPIQVYVHVVTDSKQNDLYTDDVQKNVGPHHIQIDHDQKLTRADRRSQREICGHSIQLHARRHQGYRVRIRQGITRQHGR